MSPRPAIFISAVSQELKSARQLAANTLTFLGYDPEWQDLFGVEEGDLRAMLRRRIDACNGLVQLVGKCYGAEPPSIDENFGRVSYTQYEALYAKSKGKKAWYLFLDEGFPTDPHPEEDPEKQKLHIDYRARVKADSHLYYPLSSREGLEASVLRLRDDLTRLRRGVEALDRIRCRAAGPDRCSVHLVIAGAATVQRATAANESADANAPGEIR